MLVLVTGATGFIGSHLAPVLIDSGHQVRALVRKTSDTSRLPDGVEIVKCSLTEQDQVSYACRDADIVFNLAAKLGGRAAAIQELRQANVLAVRVLLEACRNSRVRQFIQLSTPGVVGMAGVAPECLPYHPSGVYERTKIEGEKIALAYHRKYQVPVTVIRPDFVYGPGDLRKLKMFRAIKNGRFPIIGKGKSLLHPTYVDDVVRGLLTVMLNPAAYGETFNIAGPRPVTVIELICAISDAIGVKRTEARVPVIAAKLAAYCAEAAAGLLKKEPLLTRYQVRFFSRDHASDITKAEQMLGFRPEVGYDKGLKLTVDWYKKQGYL